MKNILDNIRIAFFDMDSTIIQNECIDEMARKCDEMQPLKSSCYDAVSKLTAEAMIKGTSFEEALHERIRLIVNAGFRQEWLEEIYREKIILSQGAKDLLFSLKEQKIVTVLVSGGFSFFTQKIRQELGFDEDYSNVLQFDGEGFLTGVMGCQSRNGSVISKEEKATIVADMCKKHGLSLAQSMFVGDGGNDAQAVELVAKNGGLGVAYATHNKALIAAANLQITKGQLLDITKLPARS